MSRQNYKAFKEDLKSVRKSVDAFGENVDDRVLEDTKKNRDYLIHTTINMIERRAYSRKGQVRSFIDFEDLIQNGIIGAMDALDRWFRKTSEEKMVFPNFKTFAYIWVEKHIKEYVDNNSYSVTHGIKNVNDLHKNYKIYSGDEIVGYNGKDDVLTRFESIDNNSDTCYDYNDIPEFDSIDSGRDIKSLIVRSIGEKDTNILFSYFGMNGESKQDVARVIGKDINNLNKYCKRLINKIKADISEFDMSDFSELMIDYRDFSL